MKRALLLLLLACEPSLPWDGSASVHVSGAVSAALPGQISAYRNLDGSGQIYLQVLTGRDGVQFVTLGFDFSADALRPDTPMTRWEGSVSLVDGQLFKVSSFSGTGSAQLHLDTVTLMDQKNLGADKYEIHGRIDASLVQDHTGLTVQLTAAF